jgi:hypothetical protein
MFCCLDPPRYDLHLLRLPPIVLPCLPRLLQTLQQQHPSPISRLPRMQNLLANYTATSPLSPSEAEVCLRCWSWMCHFSFSNVLIAHCGNKSTDSPVGRQGILHATRTSSDIAIRYNSTPSPRPAYNDTNGAKNRADFELWKDRDAFTSANVYDLY